MATRLRSPFTASLLALSAASLLVACQSEPETFDPDAVIAEAIEFETNYQRIDLNGVLSEHDMDLSTVGQIWANDIGAEVFRTIDVDDLTQVVEMPRGAVFVKENYDVAGEPLDTMMVLAKFEDGYYPVGGDWFFAMIQRDGTPIGDTIGKGPEVTACVDCHSSMAMNTDFIIGLPAEELAGN